MRFLMTCAAKDLRRRLADPVSLVMWLGIPLMMGGLMSLLGGSGQPPKAHVLLVDEDDSLLGRLVAGAGGQPGAEFLQVERVSRDEGQRKMDAGEASALLVLPKGLADAVVNERPATLTLVKNPAQRILPNIVETGAELLVEAIFYLQGFFAEPLRQLRTEPRGPGDFYSDAAVASLSTLVHQRLRHVGKWASPPVLGIEAASDVAPRDEGFDFGTLFLPGMIFMALLFIAQGMADDLWDEKDQAPQQNLWVKFGSGSAPRAW